MEGRFKTEMRFSRWTAVYHFLQNAWDGQAGIDLFPQGAINEAHSQQQIYPLLLKTKFQMLPDCKERVWKPQQLHTHSMSPEGYSCPKVGFTGKITQTLISNLNGLFLHSY